MQKRDAALIVGCLHTDMYVFDNKSFFTNSMKTHKHVNYLENFGHVSLLN